MDKEELIKKYLTGDYTQAELAKLNGLSRSRISYILNYELSKTKILDIKKKQAIKNLLKRKPKILKDLYER